MARRRNLPIMEAIGKSFLIWKHHRQKKILPYKITLKQLYVLRQLERKKFLCPSEIADLLFCDRPTVAVVIKNMEKKGWVKRTLSPNDFRRIHITLEPAGRIKLDEMKKQRDFKGDSFAPLSCFNEKEKLQLAELLTKLNQHLKKLNERIQSTPSGHYPQ